MAINSDIRDQAYQFFVEEAPELLQAIEVELLALHQDRTAAQIHTLMRSAHSIKGGASSVGLELIATLAHRLENIFKALYSDTLEVDAALEDQLLKAYDCLRLPLMEQITTGEFDAEQALANAEPIFAQIEATCGDAMLQTETYIPSSTDMGIDMVASIFEVDVPQGLARLGEILANPIAYEIAGELRAQAEVFAGFAELLNLPQFGAIAAAVQQALQTHPDRALQITQLALTDFEACRQAVLAGSNPSEPSAALRELTHASSAIEVPTEVSIEAPIEKLIETSVEVPVEASMEVSSEELTQISLLELESIFGSAIAVPGELEAEEIIPEAAISMTAASEELIEAADSIDAEAALEMIEELAIEAAPELELAAPELSLQASEPIEPELLDRPLNVEAAIVPLPDVTTSISLPLPAEQTEISLQLQRKTKAARAIESPATSLTVRVDSGRLEKMNNLVGELTINRNALSLQNDQLQTVVRELISRFGRFRSMVEQLRELSDQMLIAPERYGMVLTGVKSAFAEEIANFDSLEMDRFSALHPQLQDILENLVQLEETVDDVALFARQSNQVLDQQRNQLGQLQDELIWARMLPVSEVLNRFPRILRDLSITYRKPVQLKLTGASVLVEKAILEKLNDPLLHLLRNAFDHGIEPSSLRREQGKPEVGQIEIRAYHKGNQTLIEIKDDGRGLDLDRIRARILQLGWVSPEKLVFLPVEELFQFIFEPGFSTVDRVSELSGRGMGLDVVRSQLRSVKGTVSVASTPGNGTTFTLCLPLTLTITKLIICLEGSIALAIPADCVEEILTPQSQQIQQSGTQQFLLWRDQMIPTYRLGDLLNYNCAIPQLPVSKALIPVPTPQDWALPLLILRQDNQLFALEIDRLVTEQELVIKPFGNAIAPPPYTYGCTVLADGSLVPVIDGTALLTFNSQQAKAAIARIDTTPAPKPVEAPTILIVDDAATLRRTLALSLERLGFRVLQAADGREAIAQLEKFPVELIVCDVEMPNMNGFEFLSYRRQDAKVAAIPVVMLTSRSNDKHRWLAMQLGASAYFTKPYLEQEFLAALKEILQAQSHDRSVQ